MTDPAYFLYHSIGQYPRKAEEMGAALAQFADIWGALDDAQWPSVLEARQEFLHHWRNLIDAPEGTLTSAENVTTALYSLLGALPEDRLRGKALLIAADCFPSLHFLLNGLAARVGFELRTVPIRKGEFWVRDEDMIAAWDGDVALALLTFVTSTSSHRCDLARLLEHGRTQGSLIGVDITQGVGIVPFSLNDTPVDFVVGSSLKWLCGTPGAGILQVNPSLLKDCTPELRGWFSQENPFSWDLDGFAYASDARRFDHGTPSVLACLGSIPALRWHAERQGDLIRANREMTARILSAAEQTSLRLASPPDIENRGGSVMFRLPESADVTAILKQMAEREIMVDCRGPILRVSPGALTERRHVDRLIETLQHLFPKS